MEFDKVVEAFQRKKNARSLAAQKREAYLAMLKDYTALKYVPAAGGGRKEREITQELIEKKAEEKKEVEIDTIANSLIDFVDIDLGSVGPGGDIDFAIGEPTKGKRK